MSDIPLDLSGRFSTAKDPNAVLDFVFDWTSYLKPTQDNITNAVVVKSGGITIDSSSFTTKKVTVWVSGGVVGETAKLTCTITTEDGRIDERSMFIKIKEM